MRENRNAACDYCGDASGRCGCDRPGNSRRHPATDNIAADRKSDLKRSASSSSVGSLQGSKKRPVSIVATDSKADSTRPASNSIAGKKPDSERPASSSTVGSKPDSICSEKRQTSPSMTATDFCYSPKDCRACRERSAKIHALRRTGKKLPHRILLMGRSHYGKLGRLRCQMCGRRSPCQACRWNLANRSTRHVCRVRSCWMVLSSGRGLKRHKNITHGKYKRYWCRLCKIPISDAMVLRRHFLAKYQRQPRQGETERLSYDDPRGRQRRVAAFKLRRNEFLRCFFCNRTCASEAEMSDHLDAAHAEAGISAALVRFDRHYSVQQSYFRRLIDRSQDFKRFLAHLQDHITNMVLSSQPETPTHDIGPAGAGVRHIHRRLLD